MRHTSLVRGAAVAAAAALVLTACGSSNDDKKSADTLSGELAAGGSSAQEAAQNAWIVGFNGDQPDVTITYDPVGSGGGRESFISGAYPFAGSDAYLSAEELTAATERCGAAPIQVPNYVSPIALIFNVEGVDKLSLDKDTITGIFTAKITKWNDPKIAATNSGVTLPDAPINPVHRSDESGTTKNFQKYLADVAPAIWTAEVGETWPADFGGEGAKGTSGVVAAVKNGKNSIGYADASQVGDLNTVSVGVGGKFVEPSADAAAKIFEVSPKAAGASDTALIYDIDHKTAEEGVYPIVLASYLIACPSYTGDEAAVGKLAKAYLSYILSDDGQAQGEKEAGSAVLTDSVLEAARAAVDGITTK